MGRARSAANWAAKCDEGRWEGYWAGGGGESDGTAISRTAGASQMGSGLRRASLSSVAASSVTRPSKLVVPLVATRIGWSRSITFRFNSRLYRVTRSVVTVIV